MRENREELGLEAMDFRHFYTTDFFQQSAFHQTPLQVLSIYYSFHVNDPEAVRVVREPFHGITGPGDQEAFRWLSIKEGAEDALTLPIDRVVWRMLRAVA